MPQVSLSTSGVLAHPSPLRMGTEGVTGRLAVAGRTHPAKSAATESPPASERPSARGATETAPTHSAKRGAGRHLVVWIVFLVAGMTGPPHRSGSAMRAIGVFLVVFFGIILLRLSGLNHVCHCQSHDAGIGIRSHSRDRFTHRDDRLSRFGDHRVRNHGFREDDLGGCNWCRFESDLERLHGFSRLDGGSHFLAIADSGSEQAQT